MKSSEMKSSKMNMLSHSFSFKWMQICLQRFICSKKDAEIMILKFFKQCKITVKKLLEIICKLLNCLLNLMCNWVMCNENFRFFERRCTCKLKECTCKSEECTSSDFLNLNTNFTSFFESSELMTQRNSLVARSSTTSKTYSSINWSSVSNFAKTLSDEESSMRKIVESTQTISMIQR